jgi:hypothetical protein
MQCGFARVRLCWSSITWYCCATPQALLRLTGQAGGCHAAGSLPQRAGVIVDGQHVPVTAAAAGRAAGVRALNGRCQGEGVGAVVALISVQAEQGAAPGVLQALGGAAVDVVDGDACASAAKDSTA